MAVTFVFATLVAVIYLLWWGTDDEVAVAPEVDAVDEAPAERGATVRELESEIRRLQKRLDAAKATHG